MAKTTPTTEPGETPEAAPEPVAPPAQDVQAGPVTSDRWVYLPVDDIPRIYTNVPVTVAAGDVIHRPGPAPAADGHWHPTDAEPTVRPDNDPAPTTETAE